MARGKIEIKKIENATNRQVTYSKRRNGLFKKAHELTVLCDAKVSIIMFSATGKLHEFTSPSITTKEIYDNYQKSSGVDVWSTHYARMQEELRNLKEINRKLQRDIRNHVGDLGDLEWDELNKLEREVDIAVQIIRERKMKTISGQIDTQKKKLRNAEAIHRSLLHEYAREDPQYGLVDNGRADYDHLLGYTNNCAAGAGAYRALALRLQPSEGNVPSSASGSCLTTYTLLE